MPGVPSSCFPLVLSLFCNSEEAPSPAQPSPIQIPRGLRPAVLIIMGPLCRRLVPRLGLQVVLLCSGLGR